MATQHVDHAQPPAAVGLLRDFVNTREPQVGTDDLRSPAALRDWCAERRLVPAGARMSTTDLERALAVREGLRAVLLAHAGHEDADHGAIGLLNDVLAESPVALRLDGAGYRLVPTGDDALAHLLAALADSIRSATEDHTWQRLKVCARDTCRWAYYDASRNSVRRWCSMAGCGNQVKMKRAYARRTQAFD